MNRVCITKSISLQSVNGPEVTVIKGQGPIGDDAVRGVYLDAEASLIGFTITNGHTRINVSPESEYADGNGGGIYSAYVDDKHVVVSNCILTGNSAAYYGGGAQGGALNNCTLMGNSARSGGGVWLGTLNNCTLTGNSARSGGGGGAVSATLSNCTLTGNSAANAGGGVCRGTLNNCTLTGNSATNDGGGAYWGTLNNCTLTDNSAEYGGGAYGGTLGNCTLTGNSAEHGGGAYGGALGNCTLTGNSAIIGGGAFGGTLDNCTLTGNSASSGGGTFDGTLYNCTLTGNSATYGGGAYNGSLCNCIVWENSASNSSDIMSASVVNTCSSDGLTNEVNGCTTNDPLFVDALGCNFQLRSDSPCVNAGCGAFGLVDQLDAAGNPRVVEYFVDMGAYECQHSAHFNTICYVAVNSPADGPGDRWETACHTIQAAVDSAAPSTLILVSNGIYNVGSRLSPNQAVCRSRIVINNEILVKSVNGAAHTYIVGQGPRGDSAVRCVWLGGGGMLVGFTLTNGYTSAVGGFSSDVSGGGVYMPENSNAWIEECVISGCEARDGGGLYGGGIVENCIIEGNFATSCGGGVWQKGNSVVENCTISENIAEGSGGGLYGVWFDSANAVVNNCTLKNNSAGSTGGGAYDASLFNCSVHSNLANGGGGLSISPKFYSGYEGVACVIASNCTFTGNIAQGCDGFRGSSGGGIGTQDCYSYMSRCVVYNCTFTSNSSDSLGGGAYGVSLYNCSLVGEFSNKFSGWRYYLLCAKQLCAEKQFGTLWWSNAL